MYFEQEGTSVHFFPCVILSERSEHENPFTYLHYITSVASYRLPRHKLLAMTLRQCERFYFRKYLASGFKSEVENVFRAGGNISIVIAYMNGHPLLCFLSI